MLRFCTNVLIFSFICCASVTATNYYVNNSNGDDSKDGQTVTTAWKTISKVNGKKFLPGDSIFFNKGDVWRETLAISSSGTSEAYIYFGTYGTGTNPKIYGSKLATTWTNQGGNIWKSDITFTNPRLNHADIHFIESENKSWSNYKENTALLAAKYDWTWISDYIYVYSTSDPGTAFSSIEVPQRFSCIDTYHKEYIHFNGIDVFYAGYIGYDDYNSHADHVDISGLIIENCEIGYIGGITGTQAGFGVAVIYSDLIIKNCTIHDCGRRGVSLDIYGNGFTATNAIIENNTFRGGFHTTGVDLSVGSGYTGSWDGVYIRNNIFEDVATSPYIYPSNQVFLQNWTWESQNAKAENIYIYNNIFKYPNFSAINMEGMNKVYIYNNVFYEASVTTSYVVQLWIDAHNTNIKVKNNIFYSSNSDRNFGLSVYCLSLYSNIDLDYNLYYRVNNSVHVINCSGTDYYMNTITSALRSDFGWETHCPSPEDPLLVSTSDYHLQDSSPAIGKGIPVTINGKILRTDYDGNRFNNPPSIGAYEGKPPAHVTPSPLREQPIIIYPNPNNGELTIKREGSLEAQNFRIVDISGKVMLNNFLEEGAKIVKIPISLDAGIYIVQVLSGNLTTATQKLIVIK